MTEIPKNRSVWPLLLLATFVAGLIRFLFLGESPFRADTINFFQHALRGDSPLELWRNPPWSNQIPMLEVFMLWFHSLLEIKATHFSVRFLFALMGTVTVPFLFFFVRRAIDTPTAWFAVIAMILNPFHVHISREAYYYVGVTFASSMTLWAFWGLWVTMRSGEMPRIRSFLLWLVLGLFQCHTHMSSWMPFGAQMLVLFVTGVLKFKGDRQRLFRVIVALSLVAIATFIVLFPQIQKVFISYLPTAETKHPYRPGQWLVIVNAILQVIPAYTFGTWWPAWILIAASIAGGVWIYRTDEQLRTHVRFLALYFSIAFVMLTVVMAVVGKGRASFNYFSPLWPCVMAFFAVCLRGAGQFLSTRFSWKSSMGAGVVVLIICGYFVTPVYATMRLAGKPNPYKLIQKWFNENVPPGTPVLVDRWFEPWNELRLYTSKNAIFTFTVPDEPVETYIQNRWRDTAKNFLIKNPDAVYLELRKTWFNMPAIGFWHWPREYFKQHAEIRNEPGLLLQRWGLNFRPGGKNYKEGLIVEIFWNSRDDLISKAREEGRNLIYYYGNNWGYTKLWPQMQDFRDWRMISETADLQIINVTDQPLYASLGIQGVAVNGQKQIKIAENLSHTFKQGQIEQWAIQTRIDPGVNTLRFSDPLWQLSNIPLLVDQILLQETPPPQDQ